MSQQEIGGNPQSVVLSARTTADAHSRFQLLADGSFRFGPGTSLASAIQSNSELVDAGEYVIPRAFCSTASATTVSGGLRLSFFVAKRSESISQIRFSSGNIAAGATPSLCKLAVYSVDSSNNLTLLGVTANDTALFVSSSTDYTKTLLTSFNKIAGQRYALGVLVITAAATPTFIGSLANIATSNAEPPWTCALLSGQSDIPTSILAGSLTSTGTLVNGLVLR